MEAEEKIHQFLNDSAEEEWAKLRKKQKTELQQGLIVKDKALPAHTLVRRKTMSIMKYNYQD